MSRWITMHKVTKYLNAITITEASQNTKVSLGRGNVMATTPMKIKQVLPYGTFIRRSGCGTDTSSRYKTQ